MPLDCRKEGLIFKKFLGVTPQTPPPPPPPTKPSFGIQDRPL